MSASLSVKNLVESLQKRPHRANRGRISGWLKRILIKRLEQLVYGQLTLIDGEQVIQFTGRNNSELTVEITVLDEQFYWFIAFGGSVGAGEAYINQYWQTDNLTKVIRLFALNQSLMESMESGLAKLTAPIKQGFHWLNKNTHQGSRSNIVAHYDLGNDFFKLFLDPSMMYSAGIFYSESDSMYQASLNKLQRICDRIQLGPDDHLLEIGTGWGSLAIFAAKHYGCRVTTTTISDEQFAYTEKRIKEENLGDKITLLKKDYRELEGQFDKLISIEMIEAVGHHYYDVFFNQCSQLLKPEGEMLIQAITIPDQRFASARKSVDFIKRYIFPGSCIPSIDAMNDSLRKSTDLRLYNLEDFGVHYARTLEKWRLAFWDKLEVVKAQGFSDAFIRMWEFYLCYCEGGFEERMISNVQMHLVKPLARVNKPYASLSDKIIDEPFRTNLGCEQSNSVETNLKSA